MLRSNLYLSCSFLVLVSLLSSCASLRKSKSVDPRISEVIHRARAYTGTPYRWGGTSKKGIDCSGLLQNAFSNAGVIIPRTAKRQSEMGKMVRIGSIRPGDLVCFRKRKSVGKVTHVGLVTSVDGEKIKFIHASSSRGVIEDNLRKEYYIKRLRGIRRIL